MGDPRLMGHREASSEAPFRLSMGHTWCKSVKLFFIRLVCGHSVLRAGPFCKGAHCDACLEDELYGPWLTDRRPLWQRVLLRRQMH